MSNPRSMLKRNTKNKIIGGVCSGLARHLGIEPLLVRLGFVFMFLWAGIGPLLYLLLWILMPKDDDGEIKDE